METIEMSAVLSGLKIVPLFLLLLPARQLLSAQNPALEPVSQQSAATPPAPSLTVHSYSRMVTLEVVVKDAKGNHVTGLKPEDFQVFEQTPSMSKAKREQRIASFREVSMADLAVHDAGLSAQIPAGVYTNVVSSLKDPIPPTIVLVDGLNTDVEFQGRVHAAMLKMLQQLPPDVPVAVFLLGRKLVMLQDFTSDPKLLQAALSKAKTADGKYEAQLDPRDDSQSIFNSLMQSPQHVPTGFFYAALEGDARVYGEHMDTRVDRTEEALVSIARHMSGYPGRKNLLWISTAFPITIDPALDPDKNHDYQVGIQPVASALSDARIAVYPINPDGVHMPAGYQWEGQLSPTVAHIHAPSDVAALNRDMEGQMRQGDTMRTMADATGGAVCLGDNDLADCIHKAVDDSSKFYEIAYYPDSKDWNGEYRRIIVDAKLKGLHLEYRQGYFANRVPSGTSAGDDLQRAACEGPLDATAIFLAAKSLPPDPKETMKFYLMINPAALTFTAAGNDNRELNLHVGVCTFDQTGKPLHYMSDSVDQKLTAKEFQELAQSGLPHVVAVAGPKPAAVRLAVMDEASGKVGSVFVRTDGPVIAATTSSSTGQSSPQSQK
jgi:VWFA-related protein